MFPDTDINKKKTIYIVFLSGGRKDVQLELLADNICKIKAAPENNILFEEIKLFLAA